MDWSLKFGALFVTKLKEIQGYSFPNLICYRNTFIVEKRLYLVLVWVLGNDTIARMLHIIRMKRHLLGKI